MIQTPPSRGGTGSESVRTSNWSLPSAEARNHQLGRRVSNYRRDSSDATMRKRARLFGFKQLLLCDNAKDPRGQCPASVCEANTQQTPGCEHARSLGTTARSGGDRTRGFCGRKLHVCWNGWADWGTQQARSQFTVSPTPAAAAGSHSTSVAFVITTTDFNECLPRIEGDVYKPLNRFVREPVSLRPSTSCAQREPHSSLAARAMLLRRAR